MTCCHQHILETKGRALLLMLCTLVRKDNNNKETQASVNKEGFNNSDTDKDDNDGKRRASIASTRRSNGNSRAMSAILHSIQKNPPAASLPPPIPDAVRNNNNATMHAARSMASGWSLSISVNHEHASPPCASLPADHQTVIQHSPAIENAIINNNAPHEVAEIHGHELLDNVSSLSATDNDNAKSMWLLQQYFQSLAQSGTTRSIMEEKDLITTKISILFKCI